MEYVPHAQATGSYTLGRIRELMEKLGDPQHNYKVIHVAGTSGKTSSCYYIAAHLKEAGKKVGLTVSPHVDEINERIQIDLVPLPEKQFCKEFSTFLKLINKLSIKPTYFEVLVAFAYWEFARQKIDYAVVEVGLGGLLDGTNVVKTPDKVCVITDLGLDHTEILGQTLPEITAQKAGIIHPYNTVLMYEQSEEVMEVVREVCEGQQAELHEIKPLKANELPKVLPLFQRRNWYLANRVYNYVAKRDRLKKLDEAELLKTTQTYIPARMEVVEVKNKVVIMDGAHNSQKLETLLKSIAAKYPNQEIAILMALKHTKGIRTRTSLAAITKKANWLGLTSFTNFQDEPFASVDPTKLAEQCHTLGFDNWEIIENPKQAYKVLLRRPEPVLLITGSFYLLNHIRPLILKEHKLLIQA